MVERTTTLDVVVAGVSWAITVLLYVIAGVVILSDHPFAGILIAEFACGASAFAAVRSIRVYAVRACRKIDALTLEREMDRVTAMPPQRVR